VNAHESLVSRELTKNRGYEYHALTLATDLELLSKSDTE